MSKKERGGIFGLAVGLLAAVILFGIHGGCSRKPAAMPTTENAAAPVCPPSAAFCPAPTDAPTGKPVGKLMEPVKAAKVLVLDANLSDPRVITMDIPAGTWLVPEEKAK